MLVKITGVVTFQLKSQIWVTRSKLFWRYSQMLCFWLYDGTVQAQCWNQHSFSLYLSWRKHQEWVNSMQRRQGSGGSGLDIGTMPHAACMGGGRRHTKRAGERDWARQILIGWPNTHLVGTFTWWQMLREGVAAGCRVLCSKRVKGVTVTQQCLQGEDNAPSSGEMQIVPNEKACQMWNDAATRHSQFEGRCDNTQFAICKEIKKGLCWKQSLQCMNCGYVGGMNKLYDEVSTARRGVEAAAPILGWQIGLQLSS